jgi:hypothetical protein
MCRIRSHLTYANVLATLAMFVLLGGAAFAAAKISGSDIQNRSIPARSSKGTPLDGPSSPGPWAFRS